MAQGGRHADLAARGAEAVTTRLGKFVNESVASQQMNLNSAVGSLGIRQRVDRVDGMDEVDGNATHPAGERRSLRNLLSF